GITSFVYLFVLAAPFFSVMPTFVSPGGPGKYCSFAVPSWLTFFACSRSRWQCSPSNHEVPPCGPRQGAAHRPPPRGASDGVVARRVAVSAAEVEEVAVYSSSRPAARCGRAPSTHAGGAGASEVAPRR